MIFRSSHLTIFFIVLSIASEFDSDIPPSSISRDFILVQNVCPLPRILSGFSLCYVRESSGSRLFFFLSTGLNPASLHPLAPFLLTSHIYFPIFFPHLSLSFRNICNSQNFSILLCIHFAWCTDGQPTVNRQSRLMSQYCQATFAPKND